MRTTVSVGHPQHRGPIPSMIFAELVTRAAAVQETYRGDLYHDALVLRDTLADLEPFTTADLYWVLRPNGCYLTGDRGWAWAQANGEPTVYRLTIREERPGWGGWVLDVERVTPGPVDAALGRISQFVVAVTAPSFEKADEVMAERLAHDEDYGFDYSIDWARRP